MKERILEVIERRLIDLEKSKNGLLEVDDHRGAITELEKIVELKGLKLDIIKLKAFE